MNCLLIFVSTFSFNAVFVQSASFINQSLLKYPVSTASKGLATKTLSTGTAVGKLFSLEKEGNTKVILKPQDHGLNGSRLMIDTDSLVARIENDDNAYVYLWRLGYGINISLVTESFKLFQDDGILFYVGDMEENLQIKPTEEQLLQVLKRPGVTGFLYKHTAMSKEEKRKEDLKSLRALEGLKDALTAPRLTNESTGDLPEYSLKLIPFLNSDSATVKSEALEILKTALKTQMEGFNDPDAVTLILTADRDFYCDFLTEHADIVSIPEFTDGCSV